MNELIQAIIFFFALCGTFYFFGKLTTWATWKIEPKNFKKEFTRKDIFKANTVLLISIILWTTLFYLNI